MTESFSRAATIEDLKELIRSLNERGAQYLLIGGYALHAHGYERATTDIDVLVPRRRAAGETYESLEPYAITIDFEGVPVRTLSLEGLLKTKQSSRDKDAADRAVLERAIRALGKGRS